VEERQTYLLLSGTGPATGRPPPWSRSSAWTARLWYRLSWPRTRRTRSAPSMACRPDQARRA